DSGLATERIMGAYVSADAFRVLGERPVLGRAFLPAEDRPSARPVAILGYAVWKTRYNAAADVIGRTISINGTATTVVGVMGDGFRFPIVHDLWQPLALMPGLEPSKRDARRLQVVGRLADGVSLRTAQGELDAIARQLGRAYPETNATVTGVVYPFAGE